ncbi:MAG: MscL family protein [Nitrososphaerota archaeon]|jgi:large conductance mechanosensitive channel|nr:MscL family protein [Nitrososphaerota archaeon]
MPTTDEEIIEELREIKKLLTPAPVAPAPKGMWNEFKAFLDQYKVLGLAVAFILAVYLGNLVKALVGDLVLPVIGLVNPSSNLTTYAAIFRGQTFAFGDLLNNAITFIIVALVVFLIVKVADRAKAK